MGDELETPKNNSPEEGASQINQNQDELILQQQRQIEREVSVFLIKKVWLV